MKHPRPAPGDIAGPSPGGERFWRSWRWWRRTAHITAAVWVANGIAFASTVVAARGLGVRDYGVFVLAISITGLVGRFLDLTLEEAVVHYGARALQEGNTAALRPLLRTALRMDLAIGIIVSSLIVVSATPIAAIVDDPAFGHVFIRLAALTTLASTIDGTTGAVLLLSGRSELRAWSDVGTSTFRLVLVAIAARIGGTAAVLIAFAAGTALGGSMQALFSWRAGWRVWSRAGTCELQRAWIRTLLAFGVHSSIWTSVTALSQGVVPLILGRLAGPSAVGMFDVAALPLKGAEVANGGLRLSLFPQQAKLAAQGDNETLDRSVRFYTLLGLSIGIPSAIIGWVVAPWLIPIMYSDRFTPAVWPTRVLLAAGVASLSMGWAKTLMPALGKPQIRTKVSLLEFSVVMSLLFILGSRGAIGGAIAVAISYVLIALLWWVISRRTLRIA
jgi:lipopolysaccharide exporter